ncbi:unnamed protein product [Mycena citricolor]|uniref:Uncharacterized protein n=1 Tax=Mycena citricolor TaxID=2018698 RepID=A0AAD2GXX5_9AGAR|nr:unnamed protein product [Mycena citricolor]
MVQYNVRCNTDWGISSSRPHPLRAIGTLPSLLTCGTTGSSVSGSANPPPGRIAPGGSCADAVPRGAFSMRCRQDGRSEGQDMTGANYPSGGALSLSVHLRRRKGCLFH